ncbi:MAG: hypothetical protein WC419_05950 [Candidatus Omnitrophota bacterium]|jgi:hypothetical protein
MSPRYRRSIKKVRLYNSGMNCFVERMRKVRALNGNPMLCGMDDDVVKKFSFHRVELLTKLL